VYTFKLKNVYVCYAVENLRSVYETKSYERCKLTANTKHIFDGKSKFWTYWDAVLSSQEYYKKVYFSPKGTCEQAQAENSGIVQEFCLPYRGVVIIWVVINK
jgi:hypothetical protein